MIERVRDRSITPSEGNVTYTRSASDAEDSVAWSVDTVNTVYEDVMTDVVTPDFHKRSALGEIFNSPMSIGRRTESAGGGIYSTYHENNGNWVRYTTSGDGSVTRTFDYFAIGVGQRFDYNSLPANDTSDTIRSLKVEALAGIDPSTFGFMEDVFEIKETLGFMRNPVKSLLKLSKAYQRNKRAVTLRWSQHEDRAKALEELWLTYRFAVTPLWRSIEDANEAIEIIRDRQAGARPERQTSRAKRTIESNSTETGTVDFTSELADWERKCSNVDFLRVGVLYSTSSPFETIPSILGLRSSDIPESIWAVVPYSFMVDRFFDVSSMIRALTNMTDPRVRVLAGWQTLKYEYQHSVRMTGGEFVNPGPGLHTYNLSGDTATTKIHGYSRNPWIPTMSDIVPPISMGGLIEDATKIADLIALIHSRFRIT